MAQKGSLRVRHIPERLSFCASLVLGSYCTRRSGRSVIDSRILWHKRAVSVCATFQGGCPSVPLGVWISLHSPIRAQCYRLADLMAQKARSPCAFVEEVTLSHISGKKTAHGRLSFCASLVSGSHCTRRSGRSVIDSRISWHRRAVSVCATFQNWQLTNVLFCGFS